MSWMASQSELNHIRGKTRGVYARARTALSHVTSGGGPTVPMVGTTFEIESSKISVKTRKDDSRIAGTIAL